MENSNQQTLTNYDDFHCESCGTQSGTLYPIEGFLMTSFVYYLCEICYKRKYGEDPNKKMPDIETYESDTEEYFEF